MNQNCQDCKKEFLINADDQSFYERMKVPAPTFCPSCRWKRRAAFRNEGKMFRVEDAFTGEKIFSLFPAQAGNKVVTQEEWFSDSWSALDYGRDYDFSRNFFEQVFELHKEVPVYNLNVKQMIGSPYCANASYLKNCYLLCNSNTSENCMYGNSVDICRDCVDNSHMSKCERVYEGFWLENCYRCYFTIMSVDCQNVLFSRDCLGCTDCFGCTNLRKSSYCIFNKQYSKEEYEQKIAEMRLDTDAGIRAAGEASRAFWKTQPNKYHQGLKNLNSTGPYVSHSKNVRDSYLVRDSEDMRYCQNMLVPGNKDCYDTSFWGEKTELNYETSVCGENSYNLKFSWDCWPNVRETEYSMHMKSSSDCFGCVGMKNAKYCILNKQYSKEEYESLVSRIKEQMNEMPYIGHDGSVYRYGEFFPIDFVPFGYNNSLAQEHFEYIKEEAEAKGYPWIEVDRGEYAITVKAADLPEAIGDVSDTILKDIIECESCGFAFRIMPEELTFLRKEQLPLPRSCNTCRHKRRLLDRLHADLHETTCMCAGSSDATNQYQNSVSHPHGDGPCRESFQTGYSPTSGAIVYCESCYQQETS